ncbi:MAG: hypothetical protein K2N88_02640 [Muribaculaceae bacterium]|nr:hypothetical protein [Muribaculaceae bacterium]
MKEPIINPATLTEEQREAIKDRFNYHNIPDGVILHWEDRNTNLIVRYILTWLFGENFFKKGE